MYKSVLCLFGIMTAVYGQHCSNVLLEVKQPMYNFSVHFLDKVRHETAQHFVYSPVSTWLQLTTLAEGARGETLKEILDAAGLKGFKKKTCYRRNIRDTINNMKENISKDYDETSVIVVDKFFKLKKSFVYDIKRLHTVNVISLDFDDPQTAAEEANDLIGRETKGNMVDVVIPDDFVRRVLLMTDAAYFRSAWKHPFNQAQTQQTPFYFDTGIEKGKVNMMNQVGYFKKAEIPLINAQVLELPCENDRVSMLIFLPQKGGLLDFYHKLKYTSLTHILKSLSSANLKAVNVSLPRFEIETEVINVMELLYDMGVKRAFYPEKAQFQRMTDSGTINVSLMTQVVTIEVTETHVTAKVEVESIIADPAEDFNANKPFAFMLVDKETELILFAGMYSDPNTKVVESSVDYNDVFGLNPSRTD